MKEATLLFPHQLFENLDHLSPQYPVYIVEEYLFFKQYNFHKQKLVFHRASMKFYEDYLDRNGFSVTYIETHDPCSDVQRLIATLIDKGVKKLHIIDPTDNWLSKRIQQSAISIDINLLDSPLFLNTKEELSYFFKARKKKFYQTSFYKDQRLKRNILLDASKKPLGGKWSYDNDNRKKYPKNKVPPEITFPKTTVFYNDAIDYISTHFNNNIGEVSEEPIYPLTFKQAKSWFQDFLSYRFQDFGSYEDAIVKKEHVLNHSVLSPLINSGLLGLKTLISESNAYAQKYDIPINSHEGFIRQLIGWREFIRGVYEVKGSQERTTNFWKHKRKIPASFYTGNTGIPPIDITIKKILKTGYAHHIERLMILGNFMTLCEFHPDEVYRWFMELFIDAYDWVMVPNVYGMSLYADGGLMSTKPYISSSNYILKMSDFEKGDWTAIWDGLFWNFMDKHRTFFSNNPRLKMLVSNLDKMPPTKKEAHITNAHNFLKQLDEY